MEITLDTLNELLAATYDFEDARHFGIAGFAADLDKLHADLEPTITAICDSDAPAQVKVWARDLLTMNAEGMQMRIEQIATRLGLL